MKNILKFCTVFLYCTIATAHVETVIINQGAYVETCFSYTHKCEASIVRLIKQAKKRILLAGYGFTSNDIAKSIKDAHARGVKVHLVLDRSNVTSKYSRATYLANAGVDVKIDSNYAIMHHKFLVVDNTVGFGSMNFTRAGNQRNAENFNIFHNAPGLVLVYKNEFLRLYNESDSYRQKRGTQRKPTIRKKTQMPTKRFGMVRAFAEHFIAITHSGGIPKQLI